MLINQLSDQMRMQFRAEFMRGVADGVMMEWSLKDYIAARQGDLILKQKQRELDDICDEMDQAASTEGLNNADD